MPISLLICFFVFPDSFLFILAACGFRGGTYPLLTLLCVIQFAIPQTVEAKKRSENKNLRLSRPMMKDKNRLTILKDDTFINFQGMYSKRYTTIIALENVR